MRRIPSSQTANTFAAYLFAINLAGFLIGYSNFVPTHLTVALARVFAGVTAIVVFVWTAGFREFDLIATVALAYPKTIRLGPFWRYVFLAPLFAWGCWSLSEQFYGNVVPWFITSLHSQEGVTTVKADSWGGHYYSSPVCLYPTISNIPDGMLGHQSLCVYDTRDIPEAGKTLVLRGRRSIFGIRVESFAEEP